MALTLLVSAAGSGRARRPRGNERVAGSLPPGAEDAAAARRSRACWPGGRAGDAAGGERPGSEAAPLPGPRGGAGSALSLPHRRRRRRLRCGSKPNMAAAATLRARGPRAQGALGRGSAALGRRRRPGDMAGGRRQRRRRRRGALGGEARLRGSHPPRGGEARTGASLSPGRVTCPKHAHVMLAPPLAPDTCAETAFRWFEATIARRASRGWAASCGLVPPPPHKEHSPGAPLSPFEGCCSQPIRSPDACWLAATLLSPVDQPC